MGRYVVAERTGGVFFCTAVIVWLAMAWSGTCAHAASTPADGAQAVRTETTLAASVASDGRKTTATFAVHVYPAGEAAAATGVVTLVERDAAGKIEAIGSAALDRAGAATVVTSSLPAGEHTVEAVYGGDNAHAPSSSVARTVLADTVPVPGFTMAATPTSLNVVAGAFANSVITLTPTNGFTGYVTVSCSGLPLSSTCTFTPSNVFVGTQGGSSTVTIQTTAPSGRALLEAERHGLVYAFLLPGAFLLPSLAGLVGLRARRRRPVRMAVLLLLTMTGVAGISSCAARYDYLHHPPAQTPGTPAGSSSITIEATAVNGAQVTNETVAIALTVTAAK